MLCVVAVLHVGTGKLTDVYGHFDIVEALGTVAYTVDILARPFFPFGWWFATSSENDPFLEVHMHRVTPAIAAVLDIPDFQRAFALEPRRCRASGQLWRGGNPARVHVEAFATIGLDRPGRNIRAVGAAKDKGTVPRLGKPGDIG